MRWFALSLPPPCCLASNSAGALTMSDEDPVEPVRNVVSGFIQPSFERFAESRGTGRRWPSARLCDEPGEPDTC